jgi:hypothetical protein
MDESVRLWDVATGSLRGVPAERVGPVHGVAFSPDGKLLAYSTARRPVRVLQLGSGTSRSLGPAGGRRYGLAFHPDGHRLGVPSADGTASIWNLVTGESVLLAGHRSEVNTLRFSPDGKLAATTSDDWTVRFWETDSGRPYWRGPVMLPAGPEIYTHRGWIDLGVATAPPSHASTRWRSAIAEDARAASASEDGRTLCIRGFDDTVQLWDMAGDERLLERPLRDVRQVIATASSCVVLAEQKALLLGRSGTATPLAAQASAIGHGAGEILVATASGVLSFSLAGARAASFAAGRGATAVARVGPWLALGHEEGNIELCPTVAGTPRPTFTFEAVAASPVVSLLPGPMDTLIAGYHGGLVGIWMLSNGQRLDHAKLHGPVVHLRRDRDRLYVATELGDHLTLDLSVFQAGYCERLRAVWRQVPVLWQDGQPVRREPPADHECREH